MLTFFTPFDVKMIQISTFPAAPSTERVPSLAERVASLRYSINLQLLNNRVPGLVIILPKICSPHIPGDLGHCVITMFLKDLWRRRACDARERSCQALQPTPGGFW